MASDAEINTTCQRHGKMSSKAWKIIYDLPFRLGFQADFHTSILPWLAYPQFYFPFILSSALAGNVLNFFVMDSSHYVSNTPLT